MVAFSLASIGPAWALCFATFFLNSVTACEELSSHLEMLNGLDICATNLQFATAPSGLNITAFDPVHVVMSQDSDFVSQKPLAVYEDKTAQSLGKESELGLDVPLYDVRPAPGKGLGVFAKQDIKRGTLILMEAPLISVPMPEMVPGYGFKIMDMITNIETAFENLSIEEQDEYLDLHEFHFPSEGNPNVLMTIFRSNAYNTGDSHVGLFPKMARINHSCKPNAGNHWSENIHKRIIYASRDIKKDEEITVSYTPLLKTAKDRQERLEQYGFTCGCSACQSAESDKRRVRISNLMTDLEQKQYTASKKTSATKKRLSKANELVKLIEAEGLADYVARAYHLVAVFNQQLNRYDQALKWAMKELEILRMAEVDSGEALKLLQFMEDLKSNK